MTTTVFYTSFSLSFKCNTDVKLKRDGPCDIQMDDILAHNVLMINCQNLGKNLTSQCKDFLKILNIRCAETKPFSGVNWLDVGRFSVVMGVINWHRLTCTFLATLSSSAPSPITTYTALRPNLWEMRSKQLSLPLRRGKTLKRHLYYDILFTYLTQKAKWTWAGWFNSLEHGFLVEAGKRYRYQGASPKRLSMR